MLKCTKFYQLDIIKNKNMALKKMLAEGIKIFLKKKRKKCENMVQNDAKNFHYKVWKTKATLQTKSDYT